MFDSVTSVGFVMFAWHSVIVYCSRGTCRQWQWQWERAGEQQHVCARLQARAKPRRGGRARRLQAPAPGPRGVAAAAAVRPQDLHYLQPQRPRGSGWALQVSFPTHIHVPHHMSVNAISLPIYVPIHSVICSLPGFYPGCGVVANILLEDAYVAFINIFVYDFQIVKI